MENVYAAGGSVVLGGVQSTSATLSSSPYQITLANVNAGSGTGSLLVVGVSANSNAVASITYGGTPLTRSVSSFTNADSEFWYLTNPTSTGNVVVTMSGPTSAVVGVYSFSGVNQTAPISTVATNHSSTNGSPVISLATTAPNDWVLDLPSLSGGKALGSPTCTQEWNVKIPHVIIGASSSVIQASAGPATCSWTAGGGGSLWDDTAIEIKSTGATISSDLTSTTVSLNPVSVDVGGKTTVTATVSDTTNSINTPSGTVAFNDNSGGGTFGSTSCSNPGSNLVCTVTYTAPSVAGTVKITGFYGGDPTHSTSSGVSSLAVNATVSSQPTGLTASATSSSQINLSWTAPSNNGGSPITGYKIERSTDGGSTWSNLQPDTGSASTTYSDTGLAASTTYTYRVSAINSVGTSLPSNIASATTQSANSSCSTSRAICLSTNTANVGTDVKVTGSNFAASSQITLSFDGTAIGVGSQDVSSGSTVPLTITTDANGNFVAIMQVLRSTSGTHTIAAKDGATNSASQLITTSPHFYLFPTTGKPGSTILIPTSQGNGYAANSAITIKFDGAAIAPTSSMTTDSSGNFGGSFTIPSTAATGSHTISISDSNGDVYSTTLNVDPNAHGFSSQIVASGMNFPAYFAFIPDNGPGVDGSGAFMANEKNTGKVDVFKYANGQFVEQSIPFVTVPNLQTAYETNGLMGIAFDPNWTTSKYVYFYVTRTVSTNVVGEVIRYHATTDSSGNIVEDQSVGEQLILGNIPAFNNGHNGGSLKFDQKGNLVISTGDGWQFAVSQDLTTLQGKILRIFPVSSPVNGQLYTIPSTNPFASSTNSSIKKEIWAYGVRNPYTFDIDQTTGKIYVSDTGFNTWERIDNMTLPASDAGWPNYERPPVTNSQNLANYVPQIYSYPHEGVEPQTGNTAGLEALSAGAFYHGTTYPNLDGAYFYGDYAVGKIEALMPSSTAAPTIDQLSGYPVSQVEPVLYGLSYAPIYMEEWNGKLYFLDLNGNLNVLNYN